MKGVWYRTTVLVLDTFVQLFGSRSSSFGDSSKRYYTTGKSDLTSV